MVFESDPKNENSIQTHLGIDGDVSSVDAKPDIEVAWPIEPVVEFASRGRIELGENVVTLAGHTDNVLALDVAGLAGNEVMASGSRDGTVRIWDTNSGKSLGEPLAGDAGAVHSLTFTSSSSEAGILAAGYEDGSLKLWNTYKRSFLPKSEISCRTLIGHQGPVCSITEGVVDNKKVLVSSGADGTIRVWSVDSGQAIGLPYEVGDGAIRAVAFSHSSRVLASGGDSGTVTVWDLSSRQEVARAQLGDGCEVGSLAFSETVTHMTGGSNELIVGGLNGVVYRWDLTAGTVFQEKGTGSSAGICAMSTDLSGYLILGRSDGSVCITEVRPQGRTIGESEITWNPGIHEISDVGIVGGSTVVTPGENGQIVLQSLNLPEQNKALFDIASDEPLSSGEYLSPSGTPQKQGSASQPTSSPAGKQSVSSPGNSPLGVVAKVAAVAGCMIALAGVVQLFETRSGVFAAVLGVATIGFSVCGFVLFSRETVDTEFLLLNADSTHSYKQWRYKSALRLVAGLGLFVSALVAIVSIIVRV